MRSPKRWGMFNLPRSEKVSCRRIPPVMTMISRWLGRVLGAGGEPQRFGGVYRPTSMAARARRNARLVASTPSPRHRACNSVATLSNVIGCYLCGFLRTVVTITIGQSREVPLVPSGGRTDHFPGMQSPLGAGQGLARFSHQNEADAVVQGQLVSNLPVVLNISG